MEEPACPAGSGRTTEPEGGAAIATKMYGSVDEALGGRDDGLAWGRAAVFRAELREHVLERGDDPREEHHDDADGMMAMTWRVG
jgi:hypothetical protein